VCQQLRDLVRVAYPRATTPATTVAAAPIAMLCSLVGAMAVVVLCWLKKGDNGDQSKRKRRTQETLFGHHSVIGSTSELSVNMNGAARSIIGPSHKITLLFMLSGQHSRIRFKCEFWLLLDRCG
jgi:hypothetical protein